MILQGLIPQDPGLLSTTQILGQGNQILAGFITQGINTGRQIAATQLQQEGDFLRERGRVESLAESTRQFGIQTAQRDRSQALEERRFAESVAQDRRDFAERRSARAGAESRETERFNLNRAEFGLKAAEFARRDSQEAANAERLDRLVSGGGLSAVPGSSSGLFDTTALSPGLVEQGSPLAGALQERNDRLTSITGATTSSLTSGLFNGTITPDEALAESSRRLADANQDAARAEAIGLAAGGVRGAASGDALLLSQRLRAGAAQQADEAERLRLSAEGLLSGKIKPAGVDSRDGVPAAASPELSAETVARARDTQEILGGKEKLSAAESNRLLDAQLTVREYDRKAAEATAKAAAVAGVPAAPAGPRFAAPEPPVGSTPAEREQFTANEDRKAGVLRELIRVRPAFGKDATVADVAATLLRDPDRFGAIVDGAGVGSTLLQFVSSGYKTDDLALRARVGEATSAARARSFYGILQPEPAYRVKSSEEDILRSLISDGSNAYLFEQEGILKDLLKLQADAGTFDVKVKSPVQAKQPDAAAEFAKRIFK